MGVLARRASVFRSSDLIYHRHFFTTQVTSQLLCGALFITYNQCMTHAQLVKLAELWLRRYGCHIVLTEQTADSGEVPDAIGWKGKNRSIVLECKVSRSDFLADRHKAARREDDRSMGCEKYYLVPRGLLRPDELVPGWGLLEASRSQVTMTLKAPARSQRGMAGVLAEMELLLASLRRVEVRIDPQTITEFLKWKNRMTAYNGGQLPRGLVPVHEELKPAGEQEQAIESLNSI
jgi:hypothetical protein